MAKSFYNTKKEATQRVMEIEQSLLPTSVTYSGATPSSGANVLNSFYNPYIYANIYTYTVKKSLDMVNGNSKSKLNRK